MCGNVHEALRFTTEAAGYQWNAAVPDSLAMRLLPSELSFSKYPRL